MRRSIFIAAAPCLAAAAVLASPGEARAGVFIGAEFDAGQPVGAPTGTKAGYGFVSMLGYRIGIGPVYVQPEAQGSFMVFPLDTGDHTHVGRLLGGGRFGLSGLFQPAIFGHAGVGWLDSNTNGRAFDAGLSLAFKLIPILSFGAQAGYNVVTIASTGISTKWVSYGAHVAVEF
jgi:hypothetical protein